MVINLGVKKDKPQPVIYYLLKNMLKKSVPTVSAKFLKFDAVNDKINDCFEF